MNLKDFAQQKGVSRQHIYSSPTYRAEWMALKQKQKAKQEVLKSELKGWVYLEELSKKCREEGQCNYPVNIIRKTMPMLYLEAKRQIEQALRECS